MLKNRSKLGRNKSHLSSKFSNGGIAKFRMLPEDEIKVIEILSQLQDLSGKMDGNDIYESQKLSVILEEAGKSSKNDESQSSPESESDSDDSSETNGSELERNMKKHHDEDGSEDDLIDESVFSEMANLLNKEEQQEQEQQEEQQEEEIDVEERLQSLSTKMIRDERRISKEKGDIPTRADKSLFMKTVYLKNLTTSAITDSTSNSNKYDTVPKKQTKSIQTSVLLEVYCYGKGSSAKKVIVVKRKDSMNEIISLIRKKLNGTKKHDLLVLSNPIVGITPNSKLLDEIKLTTLVDGTAVTLIRSIDFPHLLNPMITKETINYAEEVHLMKEESNQTKEIIKVNEVIKTSETSKLSESKQKQNITLHHTTIDSSVYNVEINHWKPPPLKYSDKIDILGIKPVNDKENRRLKQQQISLISSLDYAPMLASRQSLPIFESREELLTTIHNNRVVVVSGQTGSGKSTQLPNYILEDAIHREVGNQTFIICTQPRRIATIALADRLSQERGEVVGQSVGYQIRLHSKLCEHTKILFCTTGVLLSRIQDPVCLSRVSHIILDEVHERQVETDFLMTILRDRLPEYPNLKLVVIILMSATLEENSLSAYFSCPIVSVKGRMYPVEDYFIDDCYKFIISKKPVGSGQSLTRNNIDSNDSMAMLEKREESSSRQTRRANMDGIHKLIMELKTVKPGLLYKHPMFSDFIAELIMSIMRRYQTNTHDRGDGILVFLSGIDAIKKVQSTLRRQGYSSSTNGVSVFILHGSLPPDQQRRVFRPTKPGEWKIVLATNIAETSITVDDITHVIDTGMMKEVRFDANSSISSLQEVIISKASSRQRAGRAGRVRPGYCWKLYSQEHFKSEAFAEYPVPEICRVPLEEVVLQVLLLQLGPPEIFLGKCLQPPSLAQIRSSVSLLLEINAILPHSTLPLTPLGYHLARIPIDVRLGKILIISTLLGCEEEALIICAALCGKSSFLSPPDKLIEANKAHGNFLFHRISSSTKHVKVYSDHLAILNAYKQWQVILEEEGREAAFEFCRKNFVSYNAFEEIRLLRGNFRGHLIQGGFLSRPSQNKNRKDSVEEDTLSNDENEDDNEDEEDNEEDKYRKDNQIDDISLRPLEKMNKKLYSYEDMNLLLCSLCAGLSPNIARVTRFVERGFETSRGKGKGRRDMLPAHIIQSDGKEIYLHPSSKIYRQLSDVINSTGSPNAFLVYHKKMAMDKVFLFDCSSVSLATVLLFGGEILVNKHKGTCSINGWLTVKISELHAVLFKQLQREIEKILRDKVESKTSHTKSATATTAAEVFEPVSEKEARQQLILKALNILLESCVEVEEEQKK